MKRLLLIFIIPLLLMAGAFRTGGYRTGLTIDGNYTFNDSTHFADDVTVAGDLTVSGAVKPGIIQQCIMSDAITNWGSGTQNTIASNRASSIGILSFDSMYVDSVLILGNFVEDSNKVDSMYVEISDGRTWYASPIVLVANGTDWGRSDGWGGVTLGGYTYAVSETIPASARIFIQFKPKAESAANKVNIYNIIIYGRPK